jgi:hypothetical protein
MSATLCGTSPLRLSEECVTCGGDASGGRRFDTKRYYYPPWVWVGLLEPVVPLPLLILCLIGRKTLEISFSVCPACDRAQHRLRWIAAGLWGLTGASILVSVGLEDAWVLLSSAVLFAAAVTGSFLAAAPLRIARHLDGVFTVKGFGWRTEKAASMLMKRSRSGSSAT